MTKEEKQEAREALAALARQGELDATVEKLLWTAHKDAEAICRG